MKTPGSGTVSERREADGTIRFWARAPDRKRTSLGVWDTAGLAQEAIDAWIEARAKAGKSIRGDTFAEFGARVMEVRELDGIRGIRQELSRWTYHLAPSSLGGKRIAEIQASDVQTFVRELGRKNVPGTRDKIDGETVRRCLSLASRVFDEAILQNARTDNPALRIKVKCTPRTEEPWDYLRPEEQARVRECAAVPEWARLMMRFAWGTGMRQGEQWNLELRDLHTEGDDPHVMVRFGSKGAAPKNGRIRRVELFGDGLEAAKRWLQVLPTYAKANPHRLVFPTVTGCRRGIGAPERGMTNAEMQAAGVTKRGKVELLPEWLRLAGVAREIRWHDLRHTCASSLVAGWWGRTWTLQEVCSMLGHSSITVTQRYAHLGETSLKRAARETGHGLLGQGGAPERGGLPVMDARQGPGRVRDAHMESIHGESSQGGVRPVSRFDPQGPARPSHLRQPGMLRTDAPLRGDTSTEHARSNRAPENGPRSTQRPSKADGADGAGSPGTAGPVSRDRGGDVRGAREDDSSPLGRQDLETPSSPAEPGPVTGYDLGTALKVLASLPPEILNNLVGVGRVGIEPTTYGLKEPGEPEQGRELTPPDTHTVPTKGKG